MAAMLTVIVSFRVIEVSDLFDGARIVLVRSDAAGFSRERFAKVMILGPVDALELGRATRSVRRQQAGHWVEQRRHGINNRPVHRVNYLDRIVGPWCLL